jgi:rRNA maturation endonuclease Nob1
MYVYVCPECDSEIPKSLVEEEDQCPDCGRYVSFSEAESAAEGLDDSEDLDDADELDEEEQ